MFRIMRVVLAAVLATVAINARASLANGSILSIDNGSWWGYVGNPPSGLYAAMITGYAGLGIGTTQATGNSHTGCPTGTEVIASSIDNPSCFFGNTAMHFTVSPTYLLSASGNTATIDMSGWRQTWNSIPSIPLGTGAWNGTVNESGGNFSYTFSGMVDGYARVTCGINCNYGDTYTLDYTATVPAGDPSSLGGVQYALHLTGLVGPLPVPLPAAFWLLGSGLFGLVGVSRRRKTAA